MNSEVTIANSESTTNDAEIAKQSANVDAVGTGGSDTTTRASGAASAGTNCNNEEDSAPQTFTMADAEDGIHASDGNPDNNKKENGSSARARKENNNKKSLNTSTPQKRKRSTTTTTTTTTTTGTAESSDPGSAVTKTRKYTRRKAPPPDIFLSPELQERLQSAQKEIDEAKKAALAVEEAERQLALAQKRVEDAEKQKNVTQERAEEVASQFSLHFPQAKGPWKEQYDMLVAYHAEHNSCIVRGHTPEMKALRNWTLRQRERYFLRDDNPNKLPWYLARQLDNLGFLWNYSEDSFQKHYNDLITFKEEFGHCAVPRSKDETFGSLFLLLVVHLKVNSIFYSLGYKENPSLAHWVKRVRFDAHKFRSDPSAVTLTESQYQKLESIGFVWENLSRSWNERFEDLLKFKAEHGHCRGESLSALHALCFMMSIFYFIF